jgi:hypothetical protein
MTSELQRGALGHTANLDNLLLAAMRVAKRILSCADKTSHMRDMNRLLVIGHPPIAFSKQNHATPLNRFESLYEQALSPNAPQTCGVLSSGT